MISRADADSLIKIIFPALSISTKGKFELCPTNDMAPYRQLYEIFEMLFLRNPVQTGLIDLMSLSLAGDAASACARAQKRKKVPVTAMRTESGIASVFVYIQPDCNI